MTDPIRFPVFVSDGNFKWHCHAEITADHIAQIRGDMPARIAALEAWRDEQIRLAKSMMAMAREKYPDAHAKLEGLVQQPAKPDADEADDAGTALIAMISILELNGSIAPSIAADGRKAVAALRRENEELRRNLLEHAHDSLKVDAERDKALARVAELERELKEWDEAELSTEQHNAIDAAQAERDKALADLAAADDRATELGKREIEMESKLAAMTERVPCCDACGDPYTEESEDGRMHQCHTKGCPRCDDGQWYSSVSYQTPAKELCVRLAKALRITMDNAAQWKERAEKAEAQAQDEWRRAQERSAMADAAWSRTTAELAAARADADALAEALREAHAKIHALMAWDNNILDDAHACREYKACVQECLELVPRLATTIAAHDARRAGNPSDQRAGGSQP